MTIIIFWNMYKLLIVPFAWTSRDLAGFLILVRRQQKSLSPWWNITSPADLCSERVCLFECSACQKTFLEIFTVATNRLSLEIKEDQRLCVNLEPGFSLLELATQTQTTFLYHELQVQLSASKWAYFESHRVNQPSAAYFSPQESVFIMESHKKIFKGPVFNI